MRYLLSYALKSDVCNLSCDYIPECLNMVRTQINIAYVVHGYHLSNVYTYDTCDSFKLLTYERGLKIIPLSNKT